MKQIFYTLLLLFIAFTSNAQQDVLLNNGFENWTKIAEDSLGNYEKPDNWITSDIIFSSFNTDSTYSHLVTKTTDKHSGSYAILLQPDTIQISLDSFKFDIVLPGILANIDDAGQDGTIVSQRPKAVVGYYKFINPTADTAKVEANLIINPQDISADDTSDIAGTGVHYFTPTNTYQSFSLELNYDTLYTKKLADNLRISFLCGGLLADASTQLFIDDLGLSFPVATSDVENIPIKIYPNPTFDYLYLDLAKVPNALRLSLVNMNGQVVKSASISDNLFQISLNDLQIGTYFYQVFDKNNNKISTGKVEKL